MKWGQEDFFPTNPDRGDILGKTDLDFDFLFFDFCCSHNSRFLDLGMRFLAMAGCDSGEGGTSRRHSRTTEFGRSKELGQDRENPISASPVWGKHIDCRFKLIPVVVWHGSKHLN